MDTTKRPEALRWGVLGAGRITESTVPDLDRVAGFEVVAIASRTGTGAARLASTIPGAVATDVGTVLGDSTIDALYVATPFASVWIVVVELPLRNAPARWRTPEPSSDGWRRSSDR